MILECDIGNSRCKWRVIDAERVLVDAGVFVNSEGFGQLPLLSHVFSRVRVVSVARQEVVESFQQVISVSNVDVEFAVVDEECAGVVCAYKQPGRLGVDRWSGVLAAYHQYGAALVIDVGSALTADLVDGSGKHVGGYIAPGEELMKSSLRTDTGKVRFDDAEFKKGIEFGASTEDAVNAGILAAQLGSLEIAIREASRQIPLGFAILITGGGASIVEKHMSEEVIVVPALVLDGLQWLLP